MAKRNSESAHKKERSHLPSLRSRILHATLQRVNSALDVERSIQERRTQLDQLARRGIRVPPGVTVRTVQAGGVHAEWIEPADAPKQRVVLYLHGGGYCLCSLDTHRGLASRLALASGRCLLNIDYRLAPEHPFPAALDDAVAAYRWLLGRGLPASGIAIGGDSAGGGLALAAAVHLRDEGMPLPGAIFLLSPWTDLTLSGESHLTLRDVDPIFGGRDRPLFGRSYYGSRDPAHPLISPLFADLQGLPPTLIQVGSDEILLDDSTRLETRLMAAGVKAQLEIWPGMWHVFQVFAPFLPEAQQAIDRLGAFVRQTAA
jgi:acetyl esterase/lipase